MDVYDIELFFIRINFNANFQVLNSAVPRSTLLIASINMDKVNVFIKSS